MSIRLKLSLLDATSAEMQQHLLLLLTLVQR